jgi:hypothetical protein
MTSIGIGLDTAKHVFRVHGVDRMRKRLSAISFGAGDREVVQQAGTDPDRAGNVW